MRSCWTLGAAALALAVAGCAPTVAELRARPPDQTWESPQPPPAVIACVRDAIDAAPRWTDGLGVVRLRHDMLSGGTERLLGISDAGFGPPTPLFDLLVEPRGPDSVVSLRGSAGWPGHLRRIVTRCAGA